MSQKPCDESSPQVAPSPPTTAKEAHLMDLYARLGVEWGDDPFVVIDALRALPSPHDSLVARLRVIAAKLLEPDDLENTEYWRLTIIGLSSVFVEAGDCIGHQAQEIGEMNRVLASYRGRYGQLQRERDELANEKKARSQIDPVTRMHNLCDGLAEHRRESPYDEKSWELADESYKAKCAELKAANTRLERVTQAARRYEWLRDNGVREDAPIRDALLVYQGPFSDHSLLPEELDAAIDDAIRAAQPASQAGQPAEPSGKDS